MSETATGRKPVEHIKRLANIESMAEMRRILPRVIPLFISSFGEEGVREGDTIRFMCGPEDPEKGQHSWIIAPVQWVEPQGETLVLVAIGEPPAWHDMTRRD
jgi:hypothetical protein